MTNPLDATLTDATLTGLNACGCDAGTGTETPVLIDNRPGLSAIRFRVGTHSQFRSTLLASLSSAEYPALQNLRTRDSGDVTIALLDAFAAMADVLTFYSERIANESYLRTAIERRSVLELARAIGYELAPGVAAEVHLAFNVEGARETSGTATIPRGTRVQSIPGPGEKPQTFETQQEFHGRAAWNALRPRLRSAPLSGTALLVARRLFLAGTGTNLRQGDVLVLSDGVTARARRVLAVKPDRERDHTQVVFELPKENAASRNAPAETVPPDAGAGSMLVGQPGIRQIARQATSAAVNELFLNDKVSAAEMSRLQHLRGWDRTGVQDYLNQLPRSVLSTPDQGVFALRERAGFFGHNAPKWRSLPHTKVVTTVVNGDLRTSSVSFENDVYPISWDADSPSIWQDSQGNTHAGFDAFLERPMAELVPGGWVVLDAPGREMLPLRIDRAAEVSRADYGISGRCMALQLQKTDGRPIDSKDHGFRNRTTTAWVRSEPLTVVGAPIEAALERGTTRLALDSVDTHLATGQSIALRGENADLPGTSQGEMIVIAGIEHGAVTTLILRDGLKNRYVRSTVTMNANIVRATHGETTQEVLGSGDAAKSFQRFVLRQQPLTYTFPRDATQPDSSLEVRVDDIIWREVPTFCGCGPHDRVYVVRLADDGTVTVQFGDGRQGARLPSGAENVRVVYRRGIGFEGIVAKEQIRLLLSHPLGVRGVSNPFAPEGAADQQSLEDSRINAPRSVLTLGRVVSLEDYAAFARDFPGVGKSHAIWTRHGATRAVLLTLLDADGAQVSDTGQPADPLRRALAAQGIPFVPVRIVSRPPSRFSISGVVHVESDHLPTRVEAAVHAALRANFSFTAREFGQGVALSEVVAVIQDVQGVLSVDVHDFSKSELTPAGTVVRTDAASGGTGFLAARTPVSGTDWLRAEPAELLLLDESSLMQLEVRLP